MTATTARMFRLPPGRSVRYRVRPIGGGERPELTLVVLRPDEGRSPELQLELYDPAGGLVDLGRVPLEEGFLAVLREVRNQLHSVSKWREEKEFDLVLADGEEQATQLGA